MKRGDGWIFIESEFQVIQANSIMHYHGNGSYETFTELADGDGTKLSRYGDDTDIYVSEEIAEFVYAEFHVDLEDDKYDVTVGKPPEIEEGV